MKGVKNGVIEDFAAIEALLNLLDLDNKFNRGKITKIRKITEKYTKKEDGKGNLIPANPLLLEENRKSTKLIKRKPREELEWRRE